ncbi:MAG: cobalamin-dependent protein, partial [Alphaproteobacteria bacterium]|nr:cobalamin-dependent protein [Alphaproteobacteria bacterium]
MAVDDTVYASYLASLIEGDRLTCAGTVDALVDEGVSLSDIYRDVFQRALYEVGRLWERNTISVATEHLASAITETVMNRLLPLMSRNETAGRRIVVACVEQEFHQLGARMVADLYEMNGWDSMFLGANTPRRDLGRMISDKGADAVGLSITQFFNLESLLHTVDELASAEAAPEIVIGGQGAARVEAAVRRR